eukprot:TRINITY_DN37662_c0_g1_i1.p1 TRINITY_DN37662_c0_g1~~TRINITY_DN37662_c0_g1_i1.p1  ORF type:complete len:433 (-),score=57.06 TRINITY_DN37662_c0_g1_i1:276-1574(-)
MASSTVSSYFTPSLLEEKSCTWVVNGFSWIKDRPQNEEIRSPALLQIGQTTFGLIFYPGGHILGQCGERESLISVWREQEELYTLNVDIKIEMSNPKDTETGPKALETSDRLKYSFSNKSWFVEKHPEARRVTPFGPSWKIQKDATQALVDRDSNTLSITLTVRAWSADSADSFATAPTKYCDVAPKVKLVSDLQMLLQAQKHTDVSLQVADSSCEVGETLRAHRLVLAARSPVFENMFFGEGLAFGEKAADAEVKIPDTHPTVAKAFLHSLYSAVIPEAVWEDDDALCHLFTMYHKYQVQDLQDICEKQIVNQLSEANVAERLMMSDLLGVSTLRSASLDFIVSSPSRIAAVQLTEGFQRLVEQRPKLLAEMLSRKHPPAKRARHADATELPSNLDELPVVKLKMLLSDRSLSTSGTKQELIMRLRSHHSS